jgi:hypothetical protein
MEKKFLLSVLLFCFCFTIKAQELPVPSPRASFTQEIGLSTFSLSYGVPAVKGRVIWGELLKYDQIWRTGANAPTTFEAEDDFEIYTSADGKDRKKMPKGKYAVYSKPSKGALTFIFNTNNGDYSLPNYDANYDKHSFTVSLRDISEKYERMSFRIVPTARYGEAEVIFNWGSSTCSFFIYSDYMPQAKNNIIKAVNEAGEAWFTLIQCAKFNLDNNLDLNVAAEWADRSVKMESNHFYNRWILAQILYKQGKKTEAKRVLADAIKTGEANKEEKETFARFKPELDKALREW